MITALGAIAPVASLDVKGERRDYTFFETNPSVALALMVPKQDVAKVPTGKRPLPDSNGRRVAKKADWYWRIGGKSVVANALKVPSVSEERDHERQDALVCLAIAESLAASPPNGATIGRSDGIYAVLGHADESWQSDVSKVGVFSGTIRFGASSNGNVAGQANAPGLSVGPATPQTREGGPVTMEKRKARKSAGGQTTIPGYINRNRQEVIRRTDARGNDHGQSVYVLKCLDCSAEYGANGTDIFQRKCPRCQAGAPGLEY
jgi:hypothetical protein